MAAPPVASTQGQVASGWRRWNVIVRGSGVEISLPVHFPQSASDENRKQTPWSPLISMLRWNENSTSFDVKGSPFWNLTPSRRWHV